MAKVTAASENIYKPSTHPLAGVAGLKVHHLFPNATVQPDRGRAHDAREHAADLVFPPMLSHVHVTGDQEIGVLVPHSLLA